MQEMIVSDDRIFITRQTECTQARLLVSVGIVSTGNPIEDACHEDTQILSSDQDHSICVVSNSEPSEGPSSPPSTASK